MDWITFVSHYKITDQMKKCNGQTKLHRKPICFFTSVHLSVILSHSCEKFLNIEALRFIGGNLSRAKTVRHLVTPKKPEN